MEVPEPKQDAEKVIVEDKAEVQTENEIVVVDASEEK